MHLGIIWLTTMVDPTFGVGACSSIGLSGVWSGWPLCRMLVMSMNPGRGAHSLTMASSVESSILGLEVTRGLESWVITREPGAEPLVLPLCWICSAWSWALLWLQCLQLLWQHCSSPRLWGTSPKGLLPWNCGFWVQTGVTRAVSSSVSLASTTFSTSTTLAASTTFAASTTSIGGFSEEVVHEGSPALYSSSGRLVEGWSVGTAHWRVPPKGVAGTKVWVAQLILGPGCLPLPAMEKDPLGQAQNGVANFHAAWNGVITKDLRILEGGEWFHSLP